MNTRAETLKNTLFSSVGIYTEYFLGMLTSIIIARHLGPDHFGAYSLVIWMVAIGVAVTNSGVASSVIKFVAELRGGGREALIPPLLRWLRRTQLGFLIAVLLAGAIVFVRYGDRVMPGFDHTILLAILLLTTCLRAAYMFNIAIAKGYENFRVTATVAMIVTPVNLGLVLAAWWFNGPMEIFLAVFTVTCLVFWWVSRQQVRRLLPAATADAVMDAELRRRVLRHTILLAITTTVSFFTATEVEILFLTLYDTAASAGFFKVGFQLATGAALLVPGVFGALLLPMMANALSQDRELGARRMVASTSYLALLAAPLAVFGGVHSEAIIGLLYGGSYAPAAPAFMWLLAAVCLSTITQGASSFLLSADRQMSLMILVIVCGLIKIVLDVILIRLYGLEGAIIAFSVGTLVGAVAYLVLGMRHAGAQLEWRRLARIGLAAALAGAAAWPVHEYLSYLPAVLLGGAVLAVVYLFTSLALRCWNQGDVRYLQELHGRFARSRPRLLARALVWAERHAEAAP